MPQLTAARAPVQFVLAENLTGSTPRHGTSVAVRRTEETLEVEFACTGVRPWATLTERDAALWNEEVVEIFLDPVGDGLSYFEIELNPLGTVCDLVLRRIASGWRRDFAWDCDGLKVAATQHASGWDAALSVPLRSIALDLPQPGDVWRVNFYRIDRPGGPHAPRELSAWSPTFAPSFHDPSRFGQLVFGSA
ncbi:MAG: carbohydrate-binding family 9-like protein [Verrucomicrobia bacterium]|nr:carbohydrate-binding family 9-like protein [Verrucomicrobiota bacterium]